MLALVAPAQDGAKEAQETPSLAERVEQARSEGVRWLLDNQRPTGAWGSHHSSRPIEVLADVPGSHQAFRVGTTALSIIALQDAGLGTPEARAAIDRGIDCLLGEYDVKRVSAWEHYNVWSFGYALQCFGERLLRAPDDPRADAMRAACAKIIERLARYQVLDGGWGYLSLDGPQTARPSWTSMSFTTATIMVGLERVVRAGVDVPEAMSKKALDSIARCRTPSGSFTYGEIWNMGPAAGINQIKGSACRTPACQLALEAFGREVPVADHRRSLEDLLIKHARMQLLSLRRPIPHESWYSISGYFYLYGHAYAAYVLEGLPDADQARYAPALAEAVLACRQPDGSFWDYPLYSYHKPYGTAYALIALARVRLEAPSEIRAGAEANR
jgi:hypothetical protein